MCDSVRQAADRATITGVVSAIVGSETITSLANGSRGSARAAIHSSGLNTQVPPGASAPSVFTLNSGNLAAALCVSTSGAGPQGTFAGLDRINVVIPQSLAGSGNVAVALSAGGQAANTVNLTIQ